MSGLDVLREARQRHPEVDVILVTAAHELDVVRRAWQGGALSYLVKPFEYTALAERLEHFRGNRAMLAAPDVDQEQIDQLFGVSGAARGPTPAELPKGLSRETAELVRRALSADEPLSATECAGPGRAVPGQRPPLPGLPGGDRRGPGAAQVRPHRPPGAPLPPR